MLNPNRKIAKSDGVDLPLMKVYLVGKISGNCMDKCLEWRKQIIEHYRKFKPVYGTVFSGAHDNIGKQEIVDYESYPVSFICPLNSGESKTADNLGLKSHIPTNMIYDKDILSLHTADVIVANLDDFMENGIEKELDLPIESEICFSTKEAEQKYYTNYKKPNYEQACKKLQEAIKNRRANLGSHFEVSVALYLRKPVILIAGNERNKYILDNHPFFSRASVVILNVEQLLKEKWIQTLYKSMAGSVGNY